MKLLTNTLFVACFIASLLPHALFAGDPLRGDTLKEPVNPGDTLHKKISVKDLEAKTNDLLRNFSKAQLYATIDSLLDLDTIDVNEVELISYYGSILNRTADESGIHCYKEGIPGEEYYGDFDLATIFNVVPEDSFPETQLIPLIGTEYGSYFHPRNDKINSRYGWRDGRMHRGIDVDLEKGDKVYAAFDGMVRIAKRHNAFGNVVIIRHYNGLETVYGHLSKLKVKAGDRILSGQIIGLGGSTGRSTGPHLHFEVRFKGQSLNPANFIDFANSKLACDTLVIKKSRWGITAFPANAEFHTVERGDSWYEIAKQYGLTVKALLAMNGSDKKYYLKVGQKIRIN